MKNLAKNILIIMALLFFIAGAFSLTSLDYFKKVENVSLSQLAAEIKNEEIERIVVKGSAIEILKKDGVNQRATKESETSLTETLKNYAVEPEKLSKLALEIKEPGGFLFFLGSLIPFITPFLLIGFFLWFMFRQAQRGQMQLMSFGKTRAQLYKRNGKNKITFKDVAGQEEAKQELMEVVEFLKNPKKFYDLGAKIPRGVLLTGQSGTGKTLLARAVAGEANVPFFHASGSEFVEMLVGVGSSRVRSLFELAKKNQPSIVFVDELDAIGRHRGAGLGGGHDEREQTLNQILVEMDGFDPRTGVVILAATNRPDILDPALLRPGRFDRKIILDLPDIKDRQKVLEIHSVGKPLAKNVDLKEIAERTPGFSGADLANVVNEGAILAARRNQKQITQKDIRESIEKVLLGPERKSHILNKKEKEIAAYHEGGHALVAASLPNADPVHKISIISRGMAAGYTLKLPSEERHFYSRSKFLDELAVALAGHAAEKLVFKEITTGATNDLEKASDIARKLVTRYGMSEKLGPVVYGDHEDIIFLGKELAEQRNYSEQTAAEIDKEVAKFIKDALDRAEKILTSKREKLEQIAQTLIKKETIERKEFERLMKA